MASFCSEMKENTSLQNDDIGGDSSLLAKTWVSLPWHEAQQCLRSILGAEPTWACGFRDGPRSDLAPQFQTALDPNKQRGRERAAVRIHTREVSLAFLTLYLSSHPSLPSFYSSPEPCTNNSASSLAQAWARDQSEPIRVRQYFTYCVSILGNLLGK